MRYTNQVEHGFKEVHLGKRLFRVVGKAYEVIEVLELFGRNECKKREPQNLSLVLL